MLELAVLGLLKEQPLHGYELKKRLGETLGSLWGISFGSLYPALRRLERDGAIESVEPEPTARRRRSPPTGSLDGDLAAARLRRRRAKPTRRTRKAYRITDRGRRALRRAAPRRRRRDDDERTLRAEARVLPLPRPRPPPRAPRTPPRRSSPTRLDAGPPRHRAGRSDRYTRSLVEHRTRSTQRDLEWVDALIAAERADAEPPIRHRPRSDRMKEPPHRARRVRVAIAGVGNCASSLVQGVEYYRNADPTDDVPGLMHVELGGYHVGDVEFVAAFDVDAAKVGLDLGKAIFTGQNNTIKFADVPDLGVVVQRGPTFDGLGKYYREIVEESPAEPVDVAQVLRDTRGRRARELPAGRLRGGAALLRAGLPRRRRRRS